MRPFGIRFPACSMRGLPCGAAGSVELHAARLLPELRGPADGGERRATGGRGAAPVADATVGAELSFSAPFSVGESARGDERGIGHRLPGDRNPSDSTGGVHPR